MVSIYKRLKNHFPILDIAQRYMDVEQRGSSYFACCPYHHEDTASLSIWVSKKMFKCFGCGEHGDIFDLVMLGEGCTHNEAVKLLAEEAGIPYSSNTRVDKVIDALDCIVETTSFVARSTSQRERIARYFDEDTIRLFKLGIISSSVDMAGLLESRELPMPVELPEEALVLPVYNSRSIKGLYFYDLDTLSFIGWYMYKPLTFFGQTVTATRIKYHNKCTVTDNPFNVVLDASSTTLANTSDLTSKHVEYLKNLGITRVTLSVSNPMYYIEYLYKDFSLNVYDAETGEVKCYLDYIALTYPEKLDEYINHSKLLEIYYKKG